MVDKLLPSWNDTPTRQTLLDFIDRVTSHTGPDYVHPRDRVTTFDNDGTLWCEKPAYPQFVFAMQRLKRLAADNPALTKELAYEAAVENNLDYFESLYPDNLPALMKIVFDTHAGMSQTEFVRLAREFLSDTNHPRFGLPYEQCIYQPMVEFIQLLQANNFKVFIATAGGMSFVRTISEEIYGVARENVIGSSIAFEIGRENDQLFLQRKPGLIEPLDEGQGKPINIELHVGRPPLLAAGNSNGDIEMLEFAESSGSLFLNLLLHHDDAEREYAYDEGAERALQLADDRGWTVVSMKEDFNKVFDF